MANSTVEEEGGGDFTTLAAALADAGTGNGDTITIQAAWDNPDTTKCTVADNSITIQTDATAKHIGRPWKTAETTYRLWTTGAGHTFTVNGTGLTVDGLDIQNTSTGGSDECIRWAPGGNDTVTVKNSVLGFASRNIEQDIFYVDQNSLYDFIINFENCMFYNAYRAVVDAIDVASGKTTTVNVNCCSGYDIGYSAVNTSRSGLVGILLGGVGTAYVNIFNTLIEINTGVAVTFNGAITNSLSVDRSITNMATWHLNAGTFNDGDNTESATFADTTGASAVICEDLTSSPWDLKLQNHANNIAQDAHTDANMDNEVGGQTLSIPATDLIGTSRPQNTSYDIGAFEIVAAAPPEVVVAMSFVGDGMSWVVAER